MCQCVRITDVSKDSTNLLLSVLAAFLVIIGMGLAFSFGPSLITDLQRPAFNAAPGAIVKEPATEMRDFTLTDQTGKSLKLSDLRGKAVMLFFGYTHCPDYCPLSLAQYAQIKKALGADADRVAFVMISLDGERDTPDVLNAYMKQFDPAFIGLTGDPEKVRSIGEDYAVQFQKQRLKGTQAEYIVAHTTFMYLLDPQGRWRIAYPYDVPRADITADIQRILAKP